jgi:hypothetical protein
MSTTMRKAREIEIKPVPAGLLCTRCKKSLPAGEFSPDPRAKRRGGKRYYCKRGRSGRPADGGIERRQ